MKQFFCFWLFALLLPVYAGADIKVSGRIVDSHDRGLKKAEVSLTSLLDPVTAAIGELQGRAQQVPIARVVTDDFGLFTIALPSTHLWKIRVEADEHLSEERILTPLFGDEYIGDVRLTNAEHLMVNVITPDGTPVNGVLIRIENQKKRDFLINDPWKPVIRYAIRGGDEAKLSRGKDEAVLLSVAAEGFAYQEIKNVRSNSIRIALEDDTPQVLQVLSPSGLPAPGAAIFLGEAGHPAGLTDENGQITIRLPESGPISVAIHSRDGSSYQGELKVEADQKPRKIRLISPIRVRGAVIDRITRAPIEGAILWTSDSRWTAVQSRKNGSFELKASKPTSLLRSAASGYVEQTSTEVDLSTFVTLALKPAAVIDGSIVDPDLQPVSGADVDLISDYRRPTIRKKSGPRGEFRFMNLNPDEPFRLKVEAREYAPVIQRVETLKPRTTKRIQIRLLTGISIAGRVLDRSQQPVAAVQLSLKRAKKEMSGYSWHVSEPEFDQLKSVTGISGEFVMKNVGAGKYDLIAEANGYAVKRLQGIEISDGGKPLQLPDIVLDPAVLIQGRVKSKSGSPVAGAEISSELSIDSDDFFDDEDFDEVDAVTAEDGSFSLTPLSPGTRLDLRVRKSGYVTKELSALNTDPSSPIEITLAPASRITGIVLTNDGLPVSPVSVKLARKIVQGTSTRYRDLQTVETNDEGRFVMEDIAPGTYTLVAKSPGWEDAEISGIEAPEGQEVPVKIVLNPEALLEGTVIRGDGTPASGAMIQRLTEERQFGTLSKRVFTDGAGNYRFHGLAPGKTTIQVTATDCAPATKEIELKSGTNRLDFQLQSGFEVSGKTVDENGAPITAARIMLGTGSAFSDENGSFQLKGVPTGDYVVRAIKEGYASSFDDSKITVRDSDVHGVEIRLRKGGVITGQIIGLEPDQFWQLKVEAYQDSIGGYSSGSVDYSGRFKLINITPGAWFITAQFPGGGRQAQARAQIEEGAYETRVDLEFGKGIALKGKVMMADEPLQNAWVIANAPDVESYASATTGPDGSFEVDGLQAGVHEVTVSNQELQIRHSERIELQSDREITIYIPQARITGRVLNAVDYTPIAGVTISAVKADAVPGIGGTGTTTGSAGHFELLRMSHGEWKLTAKKDGFSAASMTVHVEEGAQIAGIDLLMKPSSGLQFQVTYSNGGNPQSVMAAVADASGNALFSGNYTVQENGLVRITTIPDGTWEVILSSWSSAPISITVTSPSEKPVLVTLPPASSIELSIPELQDELTVSKAVIVSADGRRFKDASAWSNRIITEFDVYAGFFMYKRLPPGDWNVIITAPDGRRWEKQLTTTPGGTTKTVIE